MVMENNHLSPSQINTLLSCEAKFFFRYAMDMKIQPSGSLTFGKSYDVALNTNAEQKIESKQDMKVSDIQDIFSTEFDKLSPETDWKEENSGEVKDTGIGLIKAYTNEIAPLVQPVKVQGEYHIDINGVQVMGFTDIETETLVIDNKTSGKTPSGVSNDYLIQTATYKLMTGKDAELHFGIKNKKPITKILPVPLDNTDLEYVKGLYVNMADRKEKILSEELKPIPNRSSNLCSRKWCGYWNICELTHGGKVK